MPIRRYKTFFEFVIIKIIILGKKAMRKVFLAVQMVSSMISTISSKRSRSMLLSVVRWSYSKVLEEFGTVLDFQKNPEKYNGMMKEIDKAEFDYLNESLGNKVNKQDFLNGKTANQRE